MTSADLIARVQAIADEPNAHHPQRRKGMRAEVAERIIDAVRQCPPCLCEGRRFVPVRVEGGFVMRGCPACNPS